MVSPKLGKGLEVVGRTLSGGFRVSPADQGFVVSFTDEGFAEFFREYLRPRTRQFLYGDEGEVRWHVPTTVVAGFPGRTGRGQVAVTTASLGGS